VARPLAHQESPLAEPEHDEEREIIVTIGETIPGTALDNRLRSEQTEALVELVAAHLSRVHSVHPPSDKEKPCD
jgi:hypothetical protein